MLGLDPPIAATLSTRHPRVSEAHPRDPGWRISGNSETPNPLHESPTLNPHLSSPFQGEGPLTLRIEALRRVIKHREVHALRIARRLRIAAANRSANQPFELGVANWSFHPTGRTTGKHLIEEGMRLAQPLACRSAQVWNRLHIEPG